MAAEDDLRDIRTRISNAQSAHARVTVERENALGRRTEALDALKSEFGVDTPAEAKNVLDALVAKRDKAIEEVKQALTEAGA